MVPVITPACEKISAIIAAVVVLPLVPVIATVMSSCSGTPK